MPTAILNASQYKQFQTNGVVPAYEANGQQIPAYAFGGSNTGFSSGKKWKLFPESIDYTDLWYLYKRCDIATNAVDIIPQTLWGKGWNIKIHDAAGNELQNSPLQKQVTTLNKSVNVQGYFEEAHRYARALGLGIVILGLADDLDLSEQVVKASGLSYLTCFSNDEISQINYVTDLKNPDYGKIESYEVCIAGNVESKFVVHRSRVIHINEKMMKKDARGISVLESSYDLFQIIKNTDWSAGEAYYQNASPLYTLSWDDTNPAITDSEPTPAEKAQLTKDLEDIHVKKRYVKPKSWELGVVQGSGRIADPQMIWTPLIERIAGAVGTPKQLLLGTSAGALASGEVNLEQWYGYIANKQTGWAEPLLNEFYSKLQEYGVLEQGNIGIVWATLWEMDKKEEAEIQLIKVNAAVAAVGAPSALGVSGSALMTVEEARVQILKLSPKLGGGQQYQTNAPIPKVQANHDEYVKQLQSIIDQAENGDVSEEEAKKLAQPVINMYCRNRETDALNYLAQKTGQSLKTLPPEMMMQLQAQRIQYTADFAKILGDACA